MAVEAHYSARDIESRILAALRAAGLDPERRLTPEELGPLDHFHTGGFKASRDFESGSKGSSSLCFYNESDADLLNL